MSSEQFDKLAAAVNEKYVAVVKNALDQSSITDLKGFYNAYHQELLALDEESESPMVTPTTVAPLKHELFADVYKYLDVFPTNLQKPKKLPPVRDRLSSAASKSTLSLNELSTSSAQLNSSSGALNQIKYDDLPKPTETYRDFVRFQKQLRQLKHDIEQQTIDQEYAAKLKQLRNFSQQLEKLLPKDKLAPAAFSVEEEDALNELVNKMDDMNFVRDNHDIFRQHSSGGITSNSQRLDSLVDILSQSLLAVDSFNIIY